MLTALGARSLGSASCRATGAIFHRTADRNGTACHTGVGVTGTVAVGYISVEVTTVHALMALVCGIYGAHIAIAGSIAGNYSAAKDDVATIDVGGSAINASSSHRCHVDVWYKAVGLTAEGIACNDHSVLTMDF